MPSVFIAGLYCCAAGVDGCDRGVGGGPLGGRSMGVGQPIAGRVLLAKSRPLSADETKQSRGFPGSAES